MVALNLPCFNLDTRRVTRRHRLLRDRALLGHHREEGAVLGLRAEGLGLVGAIHALRQEYREVLERGQQERKRVQVFMLRSRVQ